MAETLNVTIDDLPELGTKAAAVAGIESMLYAAIRLREPFSPLQLRYWLDAYYQARLAAAGWVPAAPHQSPAATASPQGEAMKEEGGPEAAAETQQTAEPAAKPQRQRPVGWDDGKLPEDPETYSGAAAAAKFKREQFDRLQAFLRGGGSMRAIVEETNGGISEDQILGIRECKRVPVAVYRVLAGVLDRIGN